MEEQLREYEQELKTREQKKAKRIHEVDNENDKYKITSHVHDEMGKLMHHDETGTACGKACLGMTTEAGGGGWLDPELCAKARREEVEYFRRHKMYTRVSRETALAETDKSHPGKPSVRARRVAQGVEDTQGQNSTPRRSRWRR